MDYYAEMLKRENPIFKDSVISSLNNDAVAVIPNGSRLSDMEIEFDYDETVGNVVANLLIYSDKGGKHL